MQKALDIYLEIHGKEHEDVVITMNNLAITYTEDG